MITTILMITTVAFANFAEYELPEFTVPEPSDLEDLDYETDVLRRRTGGVLEAASASSSNLKKKGKKKLAKQAGKTFAKLRATEKKIARETCSFACPSEVALMAVGSRKAAKMCDDAGCEYDDSTGRICTEPTDVYQLGVNVYLQTHKLKDFKAWKNWNTQELIAAITTMGDDLALAKQELRDVRDRCP